MLGSNKQRRNTRPATQLVFLNDLNFQLLVVNRVTANFTVIS